MIGMSVACRLCWEAMSAHQWPVPCVRTSSVSLYHAPNRDEPDMLSFCASGRVVSTKAHDVITTATCAPVPPALHPASEVAVAMRGSAAAPGCDRARQNAVGTSRRVSARCCDSS